MKSFEEGLFGVASKVCWIIALCYRGLSGYKKISYLQDFTGYDHDNMMTTNDIFNAMQFESKKDAQKTIPDVERYLECNPFHFGVYIQKVEYSVKSLETDQVTKT